MITSLNNRNRLFALTAKGSRVLQSLKVTAVLSVEISDAVKLKIFLSSPNHTAKWGKVRRDVPKERRLSHTEHWQYISVMCAHRQALL